MISAYQDLTETSQEANVDDDVNIYDVPICVTCVNRCSVLSHLPFMPASKDVTRSSRRSSPRYQLTRTVDDDTNAPVTINVDVAVNGKAKWLAF